MALTITNTATLTLLNIISRTTEAQSLSLARLASGQRINQASDDPAGLVAMEALSADLTAVEAAIANNQRTDAMLTTADAALSQVSDLLNEIQSLAIASTSSAGLTAAEIAANQAQIDQAIASIDRIVHTTSFNGQRLLDGSLAIRTSVSTGSDNVSDIRVYSRPSGSQTASLNIAVQSAATKAIVANYATTSASQATTISITGSLGTATISISSGQNLSAVAASINTVTAETGVVASTTTANSALHLVSQGYGSDAFVIVQNISGDATNYADQSRTTGTDAVVTVNGQQATADGLEIFYAANGFSAAFDLTETGNQAGNTAVITIDGGGATFQLGTTSTSRATIGIDSLLTSRLGSSSLGYLSSLATGGANDLDTNIANAVAITRQAITQVSAAQARIGGFQTYEVQTMTNTLTGTQEALTSARSLIADVDYATETAQLNRQNVLLQSAIAVLGLANQQGAQILSLLS
ncbi:MAG: flagellin [Phycisphaerae bacterium]